jgi:hypothetical protein
MYTQEEFNQHYLEVTGNSERPKMSATAPDFEGYFKKSFASIDELLIEEDVDGN